ncbi:hypothetical protein [Burkholderia cenocepacia]|nr:hypothetical protein [Burkholderia cenocepacia]MBR8137212.1 hypothetical protein [Burkholderia cenocepacia]
MKILFLALVYVALVVFIVGLVRGGKRNEDSRDAALATPQHNLENANDR